jgi:GPH family glycoside/pentoside/hexuronide:cation symporter
VGFNLYNELVFPHSIISKFERNVHMQDRLSRRTKLLYGAGDLGFSLTFTIIGAYFAIFLTDVVGIAPGLAAAAIFIGRSWDYINDPLIGHLSDRTRSRWGRRRPFLLIGALPFALAFMLLWYRPPIESPLLLAAYYAGAYVLFEAAATFVYMPYFALTPELTRNYDERTSLTGYRMFFSIFGSLIAFTVPLMIIGAIRAENAGRFLLMSSVFAVVSALPLLLAFFGTRERPEYLVQQPPRLVDSLKAAYKNRPFVFSMGIFLFTWISIDILQTTLLYYIKFVVHRTEQADVIMATIFVTALLVLPLWDWVSRRWNKRKAYCAGIAFWAVVQLAIMSLNPGSSMTLIMALCVMAGIGVSAAHVLPWSIIPDAIEWDELKTGERHEGMFYSLVMLTMKVASSITIPLVLLVLQVSGYVPAAAVQPASAIAGIRLVIGPIPAVLLLAGILFALLYPMSRESHQRIVQELETRRLVREGENQ